MSDQETAGRLLMEIGYVADPVSFERALRVLREALLSERQKVLRGLHPAFERTLAEAEDRSVKEAGLDEPPGFCSVCLERQYMSPAGLTCPQGHGDADTLPACTDCGFAVTDHSGDCPRRPKRCPTCKETMSWSPSGHYCGNDTCREFHDDPAF